MTFKQDYMRGLDAIYEYAPYFYRIMRFIGIPQENYDIPTAQVSYNPHDKTILFEVNPELIEGMSDEEVGFVVSHEAYHVLLSHLKEVQQRDEYPDSESLLLAHEAIINDTVGNVLGLDAPDMDLVFGDRFGADFSGFSTREAYDWIRDNEDENSSNDAQSEDSDSGSDSNDDSDSESNGDEQSGQSSGSQNKSGNASHGCGGVFVPEGFEDEFIDVLSDVLKDAMDEISQKGDSVPTDFVNVLNDIEQDSGNDITGGYSIGNNTGSMFAGKMDDMNLDWKMLIAEFNPKILTSGGSKFRDSWTSPNRRMISVYPKVVMPNRVRKDNSGDNGDDVPTFILALDMSYSIPERLIAGLANLADTVPDKFVRVMPVTWADDVLEFDTKQKKIVYRGGTNIDAVWDYSQKVKKEIGKEPYVFVITDGQCSFNNRYSYSYGSKGGPVNDSVVRKNWYWGAIQHRDVNSIKVNMRNQVDPEKVYLVDDFLA